MSGKMFFYAPNVHAGGGGILMREVFDALNSGKNFHLILDERVKGKLLLPFDSKVTWVKPSIRNRFLVEIFLFRSARVNDVILCFHGLPILFKSFARVIVFQQNRNIISDIALNNFNFKTALRIRAERLISKIFKKNVDEYIVQTPSMYQDIKKWYGETNGINVDFKIIPFINNLSKYSFKEKNNLEWDFVYVASGEGHKNHKRLVEAWCILASEGIKPKLALTIGDNDRELRVFIKACSERYALNISCVGLLTHEEVMDMYLKSKALIFPSLSESFGLPLLEARLLNIPIIAPDLDYVWDVCEPIQTFNPLSSISICRAVKRFMNISEPFSNLYSAKEFISMLNLEDR